MLNTQRTLEDWWKVLQDLREGIRITLDLFEKGYNVILIAPTSYGKTNASPALLDIAKETSRASSLIHVVPLRALVKRIVTEKFSNFKGTIGYQSMGFIKGYVKSPYFLRDLTVTTLDSFLLNLYRIPVSEVVKVFKEVSQGHFYVAQASILSSLVVFDEAHVYTGNSDESNSVMFVRAAIDYLSEMGVPIVVETATMHSSLIQELKKMMGEKTTKIVYVGNAQSLGNDVVRVEDKDFESTYSINWRTEIVNDGIQIAKSLCENQVVLFIRNTVGKAVESYQQLKDYCDSALIHGLLNAEDREKAEDKINEIQKKGKGVIVATQVIEAGVEGEASVLITDAAPVENLAQRAGRLCRKPESKAFKQCVEEGAKVYLIEPTFDESSNKYDVYDLERVKITFDSISNYLSKGKQIDWRLLSDRQGVSFAHIIEAVNPPAYNKRVPQGIFKSYLSTDQTTLKDLLNLLENLGIDGFIRDDLLVSLSFGKTPEELERHSVSVELSTLLSKERKRLEQGNKTCLEYDNGKAKVLVMKYDKEGGIAIEERHSKKLTEQLVRERKGIRFRESYAIYESDEKTEFVEMGRYLLLNQECYKPGLGLEL